MDVTITAQNIDKISLIIEKIAQSFINNELWNTTTKRWF